MADSDDSFQERWGLSMPLPNSEPAVPSSKVLPLQKGGPQTAAPENDFVEEDEDSRDYRPFKRTVRPVPEFDIWALSAGAVHTLSHSRKQLTLFDAATSQSLTILYENLRYTILGRNLAPIRTALRDHRCLYIREFSAEKNDPPKDASAPFVSSILIENLAELPRDTPAAG